MRTAVNPLVNPYFGTARNPKNAKTPRSPRLRRVPSPASSTSIGSSFGRRRPARRCDAMPGLNPMMTALSGAPRRCLCFGRLSISYFGAFV